MPHHITVTHEDRLRLDTMLQYAQANRADKIHFQPEHANRGAQLEGV